MGSSCPRYFPFSPSDFGGSFNISYHFNYCSANPGFDASPGVWHEIHSPQPLSQKLIILFLISADGRSSHFRLRVLANHLASIFFLPLSGDSLGLLYGPCTPLFTHPVTGVQTSVDFHFDLDLCYLRNWPRFLFQRSVLGLLIQIRRNSNNPLFLFSQWETTWH